LTHPPDSLNAPSNWVRRYASLIPRDGVVLDLACGSGRHAIFLAHSGYQILAVDRDISIISQNLLPQVTAKALNLEGEDWPLRGELFSGIVVTNYLYRPYLDCLPEMLEDGGVLIYETFALGNAQFGKPSNPNFLLNPGELLAFAANQGLKVLAYEDIYVAEPKPAMIQRICAVKGEQKGRIPLQFHG
jgi:SAM-dependent methyltransferase